MHYYQFNIGDYASHTRSLSPMEDLAYRRMIDLYYLNERPLNMCSTRVAREIGLNDHVDSVEYILDNFFYKTDEGFRQKRIDREIKKYQSNSKQKSKAGKASGKARRNKALNKENNTEHTVNTCSTDVQQTMNVCSTNDEQTNNHKPITINHKPSVKNMSSKDDLTIEIFEYWVYVMNKNKSSTKLTPKRKRNIRDRLKDGYTVDQIKLAIDGCRKDPFSMGQNSNGKPYNDIELICRTGEKLESFTEITNENFRATGSNTGHRPTTAERLRKEFEDTYGHEPASIDFFMDENVGDIRGTMEEGNGN